MLELDGCKPLVESETHRLQWPLFAVFSRCGAPRGFDQTRFVHFRMSFGVRGVLVPNTAGGANAQSER